MAAQPGVPGKTPGGLLRELALAMELPFVMIGAVLIGGGLGYLLDHALHSSPAFTLTGGLLGFGAGVWEIIRRLSRSESKQGNGDGGG